MKTNLSFLIMLFVAVITFVNDIIIYVFKIDYLLSLIISFMVGLCLFVALYKKKKIQIENFFDKFDFIFVFLFLVWVGIKIVIPSYCWDVICHHYYNQEYTFADKLNFDFLVAGGSVNDWVFPLGDRMNYIFRFLLGIRLGTCLSYFSAFVIYYQIKKILKYLKPNCSKILTFFTPIFVLFIQILYRYMGTYNIDNFSVVFLLEIFYVGIKEKDLFNKKEMLYYWFLLAGITIGIKISNLVLIIPIGINIIINNIKLFKSLKIRDYIISILLFFLPFFVYGINNYVQVGNFFYPFLGRKKYFDNNEWNDPHFGISNFWYSFIWPIIVSFSPGKGQDEFHIPDYIWAFGYILTIINIIIKLLKKEYKTDLFRSEILTIIFCFLWANFMNGYCRYALVIPVLFITNIVANVELKQKNNGLNKFFSIIQLGIIIVIYLNSMRLDYVGKLKNDIRIWKKEVENVFIDNNVKITIDGVWGTVNGNGGMTSLIRESETPIYTLDVKVVEGSNVFYNKYLENIKNKDIYIVTSLIARPIEEIKKILEENNFEIIEKVAEYDSKQLPYLISSDIWEVYKIRYKN